MPKRGRVTELDDERGFGFITPIGSKSRVFVHITRFIMENAGQRWMISSTTWTVAMRAAG